MEVAIILIISALLGLGMTQVDHRIQEERQKKHFLGDGETEIIIQEMKWAPCPKINGITVCEKEKQI